MHQTSLKIPIGESDFRLLIQGHYYFVDKSLLIQEILDDARVILITRPRRFGKTLNLSMLRYYFAKEVDGKKSIPELFDGLKIQHAEETVRQHQGQYPVIFLTFKDLKHNSYEDAYAALVSLLVNLYTEHDYLLKSSALRDHEKNRYQNLLDEKVTKTDIEFSLKQLSIYLHHHHGIEPIILIDEYDTPIQSGYLNGYYSEIVGFFRNFLGAGLKDNPHCFKAVLTGILRVSKESLFSGLNNIRVYSVLQARYGEYFGFTEDEVQTLLEKTGLQAHSQTIRYWYNGYKIGPHTIYNPWSLLNCVAERGQLRRYWLNTSDNTLVKDCLYRSGLIHKETFEHLLQGQSIECFINEHIVFPDLKTSLYDDSIILSFLLMAGYFKVISVRYTEHGTYGQLAIPNIEIRGLYGELIKNWLMEGQGAITFNEFLGELLRGDMKAFEKSFRFLLEHTISVHDLSQNPEAFYHGFMTGLTVSLQSHPDYQLKSNQESGYGRYDYLILSRVPEKPTLLMEFKRVQFPEVKKPSLVRINQALEKAAQQAFVQIEEKAYATEARQSGHSKIIKIALAFYGKRFKLIYTTLGIFD